MRVSFSQHEQFGFGRSFKKVYGSQRDPKLQKRRDMASSNNFIMATGGYADMSRYRPEYLKALEVSIKMAMPGFLRSKY